MPLQTAVYHVLDRHPLLKKFAGSCLASAARGGRPLTIIALRIDGYDELCAACGESNACATIRQVHELLKAKTRSRDLGGRLDGGELLIVAPDTGSTGAWVMAERIRGAVEQADFAAAPDLTVSIGVAEYETGDGLGMLVGRAREAVAEAGRAGGNQIRMQPPTVTAAVN